MDLIQHGAQGISAFLHRFDTVEFAAMGLVLGLIVVGLLAVNAIAARRLARQVVEFRDASDDHGDRQREILEAMLRQINGCAIDIAQLKQQMNTYASTRENQLEERKKILKTIAGHLANAPQRGV